MTLGDRWERLRQLAVMPRLAGMDHRHFLDEEGEDVRLNSLPRKERRKVKAQSKILSRKYFNLIRSIYNSGSGYPIDQAIRNFAAEYNNRYAASGVENQPTSFNYIEPFLSLHYFEGSLAPYLVVLPELDHLFHMNDFLDFSTDGHDNIDLQAMYSKIPESRILNYTTNGNIEDNRYTLASGREFVVSGFSFVRHGNYIEWILIGGQTLSEEEWRELGSTESTESQVLLPHKSKFLAAAIAANGSGTGLPLPLQGTERSIRKILAGEFDYVAQRHLTRCLMSEFERAFMISSDDPETYWALRNHPKKDEIMKNSIEEIEATGALWSLVNALLFLPDYFEKKIDLVERVRKPRSPTGMSTNLSSGGFEYVSSLRRNGVPSSATILSYAPKEFLLETSGSWRPLAGKSIGRGPHGEPVVGRTWVSGAVAWQGLTVELSTSNPVSQMRDCAPPLFPLPSPLPTFPGKLTDLAYTFSDATLWTQKFIRLVGRAVPRLAEQRNSLRPRAYRLLLSWSAHGVMNAQGKLRPAFTLCSHPIE